MSGPQAAATLPGLFAEIFRDPELTARYRATFAQLERASVQTIIDRAMSCGELRASPDFSLVHAVVQGAVFSWLFVLGEQLDDSLPQRLAALAIKGLSGVPGSSTLVK